MEKNKPKYTCKLEVDGLISKMYKDGNPLWILCSEPKTNRVGMWRFDTKKFIPMVYEGKELTVEEFNDLRQKIYNDEIMKKYINMYGNPKLLGD